MLRWQLRLILLLGLLVQGQAAQAQRDYFNWYFGPSAGLTFGDSPARGLADGAVHLRYGTACISDSAGQFLLASDGYLVWDRRWQALPGYVNSHRLSGFGNREALVVRQPGPGRRYYIIRGSNQFSPGQYPVTAATTLYFPYAVVDAAGRGGYGAIVARDSVALPMGAVSQVPYYYLNGNWVAIHHANGRDIWLVAQNSEGYYTSWLLTAAGLGPPQESRPLRPLALAVGSNTILRASPDGRTLVSTALSFNTDGNNVLTQLQLAAFDAGTGLVPTSYYLPRPFRGSVSLNSVGNRVIDYVEPAGLAFSPDASRLYVSLPTQSDLLQYDLLAGTPAAIAGSETRVLAQLGAGEADGMSGDMQLGPDGNIYVIRSAGEALGRIEQANAPAPFCRYVGVGVRLPRGRAELYHTFPIPLNDLNLPPVQITDAGSVRGVGACAGTVVPFASSLSPFVSAAAFAWDFGDPTSGPLNQASGQAPTHRFDRGGTYVVTVRITATTGRQFTASQDVIINDCDFVPTIITPNGDGANDTFTLGDPRPEAYTLTVFNRWGREVYRREPYDNSWVAEGQPAGIYYYLLTHRQTGQRLKGWVEVVR